MLGCIINAITLAGTNATPLMLMLNSELACGQNACVFAVICALAHDHVITKKILSLQHEQNETCKLVVQRDK